jgi:hypothetical protein
VGLTGLTAKAEVIEKRCAGLQDMSNLLELYAGFKNELKDMILVVEEELIKLKAY